MKTIFTSAKLFSSKVVSIPPSIKTKAKLKTSNVRELTPIYNLLKSQKFAENKQEVDNYNQMTLFDSKVRPFAEKQVEIFTMSSSKAKLDRLHEFLSENLNSFEMQRFNGILASEMAKLKRKTNLEPSDFYPIYTKIYSLTNKKFINIQLFEYFKEIPLSAFTTPVNCDHTFENKVEMTLLADSSVDLAHLDFEAARLVDPTQGFRDVF